MPFWACWFESSQGHYVSFHCDPGFPGFLRFLLDNWQPALIDRLHHDRWTQLGSKALGIRANERARRILVEHTIVPLSDATEEAIDEMLREREASSL